MQLTSLLTFTLTTLTTLTSATPIQGRYEPSKRSIYTGGSPVWNITDRIGTWAGPAGTGVAHPTGVPYYPGAAHPSGAPGYPGVAQPSGLPYYPGVAHPSGLPYYPGVAHPSGMPYYPGATHPSGVAHPSGKPCGTGLPHPVSTGSPHSPFSTPTTPTLFTGAADSLSSPDMFGLVMALGMGVAMLA